MKKFLAMALLVLAPHLVFATGVLPEQIVPTDAFQFSIDRQMGNPAQKFRLGRVIREAHTTAVGTFDYAVFGGATGTYNVGPLLPAHAIVTNVFVDTVSALTSGASATVAWGLTGTVNNLKTALAYGSYTGQLAGAVVYGTPSGYVKVGSTAQYVTATIATAALTAGKMKIFVSYVVSE